MTDGTLTAVTVGSKLRFGSVRPPRCPRNVLPCDGVLACGVLCASAWQPPSGLQVATTPAAVAGSPPLRSQIRCLFKNPDVRNRKTLHEPIPGDATAKAGRAWRVQHEDRHIGNEAGNVSMFAALGFKRIDPVEEYFPTAKRA